MLTIETRFRIGDKIFFIENNEISTFQIAKIEIEISKGTRRITYVGENWGSILRVNGDVAFGSKDGLIKYLKGKEPIELIKP